jgi:hypothetical protein
MSPVLGLLLSATLASAAPTAPAEARREAAVLESTLTALTARLDEERERDVLTDIGEAALLAELDDCDPSNPDVIRRKAELNSRIRARRAAELPASIQATLLARRLEVYRRTGVLPPMTRDDGAVARALGWDQPPSTPKVDALPGDLVALSRRLGLPAPPKAPRPLMPAAPPAVAKRSTPARPISLFMPDRGTGRAAADPVPELIAQLREGGSFDRALAADELAGRGDAAAPAVPALRRALADADPRVRSSSVTALGSIVTPDSAAVADMRVLLADRDEDVRFSAKTALRRLGLLR